MNQITVAMLNIPAGQDGYDAKSLRILVGNDWLYTGVYGSSIWSKLPKTLRVNEVTTGSS